MYWIFLICLLVASNFRQDEHSPMILAELERDNAAIAQQRIGVDPVTGSVTLQGIDYAAFITKYVNKRNPATGMYWYLDEVAEASNTPRVVLDQYITRAQQFNLSVVRATGRSATERQLLSAPELTQRGLQSMRKESGRRVLALTFKTFKMVQHRNRVCLEYTR